MIKTFHFSAFGMLALLFLTAPAVYAERPTSEFLLWTGSAPGALGTAYEDMPTLTPYYPASSNATGAAMIVCPGGAYGWLADPHEGENYALWLNDIGISAFVLKYRLGPDGYHYPIQMWDAQRAIRYVRANAEEWDLDPNRIGIIGSSAGGHLAATTMVYFDEGNPSSLDPIEHVSCRPDIGALCYPVITMYEPYTHIETRENLLGESPGPVLLGINSLELHVTTNTPPTFLFHTVTDGSVHYTNSTMFAAELESHDVPYELHLYPSGGHGIGLGANPGDEKNYHGWVSDCAHWLYQVGFGHPHLGNIWPLGDSITDGVAGYGYRLPGGYREPLYTNLTARGYDLKFVGTSDINPSTLLTSMGQEMHDGHSGWTIANIEGRSGLYEQVNGWYTSIPEPDIILLMIGINDLNHDFDIATAPDRLDLLITRLFELDPNVRILISSLPDAEQDNPYRGTPPATNDIIASVSDYNAAMASMVAARRILGQNIELIDMHAGLTLADLDDGLHPNPAGHVKMAHIWADAIIANPPNFTGKSIDISGGMVSLTASGALGTSYSLWMTQDLETNDWTLMTYDSITTNPFTVMNMATNDQQFYRFSAP